MGLRYDEDDKVWRTEKEFQEKERRWHNLLSQGIAIVCLVAGLTLLAGAIADSVVFRAIGFVVGILLCFVLRRLLKFIGYVLIAAGVVYMIAQSL